MLSPKRSKYRKAHKGRVHGLAKGGTTLNFGAYGLKAADPGRITARQLEASPRGPSVDPRVSRCPGLAQTSRGAHGQRQGIAGVLDLPDQAGAHHVRA